MSRENLRDEVLTLLQASREMSPRDDQELADAFVGHLEKMPGRTGRGEGLSRLISASVAALAVSLAIPVVMVIQKYRRYDGYLPQLDPGALPVIYWLALMIVVLILAGSLLSERTGWGLRVNLVQSARQWE